MRRSQREGRFDPHPQARRRPQQRGRPSRVGLPPMFATPFLALRSLTHSPRSLFTLASLRVRVRVWRVTFFSSSSSSHSFNLRCPSKCTVLPERVRLFIIGSPKGAVKRKSNQRARTVHTSEANGVNGTFKCKCNRSLRAAHQRLGKAAHRRAASEPTKPTNPHGCFRPHSTTTPVWSDPARAQRPPSRHAETSQFPETRGRAGHGTARHGTTRRGRAATIATASLPCPARTRRRVGGPAGPAGGSGPAATRVTRDGVRAQRRRMRSWSGARAGAGWLAEKKTNAFLRRRGRGEGEGDGWPHLPRVFLSCLPRRRQRASEHRPDSRIRAGIWILLTCTVGRGRRVHQRRTCYWAASSAVPCRLQASWLLVHTRFNQFDSVHE